MSDDLPWFKCNPAEWLQSCADMESDEFGFYARVILFMYQRGGLAPYDEGKLRYVWNCPKQKARKVRDDLIKSGRIERVGDELTQSRVKRELRIAKKIGEKLRGLEEETDEKVDKNLPKTEQKVDKNLPKTPHVFSRNSLKTNDPPLQIQEPDPEEEKEERKEGEKAPSAQAREAPFDSEKCKPRPEDLKRLQETYPAQGLANSPPQALLVPIGKAAVRLGSMEALLAAKYRPMTAGDVLEPGDPCEVVGGLLRGETGRVARIEGHEAVMQIGSRAVRMPAKWLKRLAGA